ncbi:MAG TPA: nickel pincer cofactor biosynthesis protein LarB [Caulobacteraceae bacterium]
MSREIDLDFERAERIGLEEAIYCAGKSPAQIAAILEEAAARQASLLLTRLDAERLAGLPGDLISAIDYCAVSRTGFVGPLRPADGPAQVAIVAAGTSDAPVAREAERVLRYQGRAASMILDVGVAGLHRLTRRLDEIGAHPVVIVCAGMDAALASVLGGLVSGAVIAVPTSVGYGAAEGGRTALNAMLASCAPGIAVVNIDNGYGAACAALRVLHAGQRIAR